MFIQLSTNKKYNLIIYQPKYHSKFNNNKHFWYSSKKFVQKNYNYTLDNLQRYIFQVLPSIFNHTLLTCFQS